MLIHLVPNESYLLIIQLFLVSVFNDNIQDIPLPPANEHAHHAYSLQCWSIDTAAGKSLSYVWFYSIEGICLADYNGKSKMDV
jgi:hypothetical protein